jgi:hypothetical protein
MAILETSRWDGIAQAFGLGEESAEFSFVRLFEDFKKLYQCRASFS